MILGTLGSKRVKATLLFCETVLWSGVFVNPPYALRSLACVLIPGGGGAPYSGLYGEAPPERGAFFKLAVYRRVGKIATLVYEIKGHKLSCKVEEMVAKAKYLKGRHILAEIAMGLSQND